jgi:mannose-1-phosphate guanylyltransferase/mannose-6-phosphate isomerase
MDYRITPAIMSGGSGTRLWPTSTESLPKQFHALLGPESLIESTLKRVRGKVGALCFAPPIILANARHEVLVDAHLARVGTTPLAIALEPMGRNTAATGVLAAAIAAEETPDALVLLLPADQVIGDVRAFHAIIERAAPFAIERIVTFGIEPDRPATGYGYIKRGPALGDGVFAIDAFKEKPTADIARTYLEAGGYSWNAGVFLFRPGLLLREFEAAAKIRDCTLEALRTAARDGVKLRFDAAAFERIPEAPLDVAVMEQTKVGAVAPCSLGWADIGSWDEVLRLSARDGSDNAIYGPIIALDAAGNLLRSEGPKLCVAGVFNLVVIATPEVVLIVPHERAQDVKVLKKMADKLK